MNLAKKHKQTAVHWAKVPATPGGDGNSGFSAGVDIAVRWEDVPKMIRNRQGNLTESEARVYYDTAVVDVVLGDRLFLGAIASLTAGQIADPSLVEKSREVFQIEKTPNMRNTQTLGKAELELNGTS